MKTISLILIKLYQRILSPLIGKQCRFYPSCSQYAHDAIEHHGIISGGWLAIQRLLKCPHLTLGGLILFQQLKGKKNEPYYIFNQ